MNPRRWTDRDPVKRNIQFTPGSTAEGGAKIYSCAYYAWPVPSDSGNAPIELTIQLDYPYLIDALFLAGDPAMVPYHQTFLTGPFEVYVGWSSDYTQNPSCTSAQLSAYYVDSLGDGCTRDPHC